MSRTFRYLNPDGKEKTVTEEELNAVSMEDLFESIDRLSALKAERAAAVERYYPEVMDQDREKALLADVQYNDCVFFLEEARNWIAFKAKLRRETK